MGVATDIYETILKLEGIDLTLVARPFIIAYDRIALSQVYIQFMRSARRTGGVKAARTVFKRAREDPRSTWQVG